MTEHPKKNSFELQYELLLNAIPSSVLIVDRKMLVLSVNDNFLLKSQRVKESTVGRPLAEVFPLVILQSTGIEENIRHVFQTGIADKGQKMTYRAPGVPLRIYYYSILPIQNDQIILIMEDVTEQFRLSEEVRRVERHLASVVESASDMVLSTDIDGQIVTWNSAAEKLSGLTTQQVHGCYFFDFCDPIQKQHVQQIFQRMKTSNASHTTEFNLLNPNNNGTIRHSAPIKSIFLI
jgi:PAS domain S-box-containing protein